MNEQILIEQLKNELKKLVKNNTSVKREGSNYIININGTELTVPLVSNQLVRKNILNNK